MGIKEWGKRIKVGGIGNEDQGKGKRIGQEHHLWPGWGSKLLVMGLRIGLKVRLVLGDRIGIGKRSEKGITKLRNNKNEKPTKQGVVRLIEVIKNKYGNQKSL